LYPQLFETSEKFVLNYYDDKVSDFLNPPKTEKLKSKEDGIHKKKKPAKKAQSDINLPKEDIRVEKGQPTFLPALKKILRRKNEQIILWR